MAPPEWTPSHWNIGGSPSISAGAESAASDAPSRVAGFAASMQTGTRPAVRPAIQEPPAIERAAGTGLTGSSAQEFVPIQVGELETEATVIRLRLVIGSPAEIDAPRPLPDADATPWRPASRP